MEESYKKVSFQEAKHIIDTEPNCVILDVRDEDEYITLEAAQECIQKRAVRYDKNGDNHYDTISAFIKSMRGSDPDAAVYYLARMLFNIPF